MFESALLKIGRADRHIQDFEGALREFQAGHGHTIRVHGKIKGPMFFETISDAPLPIDLSLILSDALHNLRTALDHATWELVGIDDGVQDRFLKLPTGNDQQSFDAACRGMRTPNTSTKDFFTNLAIYPGGVGELIYWLCQLDNAEKHTIISPVVQAASVDRIIFIDLDTKERWASDNVVLHPGVDGRSYIQLEPGLGVDCSRHFNTKSGVFFGKAPGVSQMPVIPKLFEFREAVVGVLTDFQRLVDGRSSRAQ